STSLYVNLEYFKSKFENINEVLLLLIFFFSAFWRKLKLVTVDKFKAICVSIADRSSEVPTLKYLFKSFNELLMIFSSFFPCSAHKSFNPTVLLNTNLSSVESLSTVK